MLVTEYHIVEITEIYSNQIEISSNQIFSNFFAKCYFHEIFAKKRVTQWSVLWIWQKFRESNALPKEITK